MHKFIFIWACLAFGVCGRRLQSASEHVESNLSIRDDRRASVQKASEPMRDLGMFLLALHPKASFNPSAPGLGRMPTAADSRGQRMMLPQRPRSSSVVSFFGKKEGELWEDQIQREYYEDLLKYGGGSFGTYYLLTTYTNIPETVAGNIVLFSLLAYGAYLLYFDGGQTQSGLEYQAYKQLVMEEEQVMLQAEKLPDIKMWDGQTAVSKPKAVGNDVATLGFTRVDKVLSSDTASALWKYIDQTIDEKAEAAKEDFVVQARYFGEIVFPDRRYSYLLDLEPPVVKAFQEALPKVKPAIAEVIGEDAVLAELAAVVTNFGSPRQPVQPKTFLSKDGRPVACVTVAVALQDVAENNGWGIVPRTNNFVAHERFKNADDGNRERMVLLRESPAFNQAMTIGDATLRDPRVMQWDSENDNQQRRVFFYFTFQRSTAGAFPGSLMSKFKRVDCRLNNTDEWLLEGSVLAAS